MPKLAKLKYEDFDTRMQHGLQRVNCMSLSPHDPTRAQVLRLMDWAEGFGHLGLMNLLFMPHFGHILQFHTYVKHLLVFFHRGFLWLDKQYPIDAELISVITGLPNKGDDPAPYLA